VLVNQDRTGLDFSVGFRTRVDDQVEGLPLGRQGFTR
jgi:hypothetical protein